jgi:hypothetical protein
VSCNRGVKEVTEIGRFLPDEDEFGKKAEVPADTRSSRSPIAARTLPVAARTVTLYGTGQALRGMPQYADHR